jgi:hypothetical protein
MAPTTGILTNAGRLMAEQATWRAAARQGTRPPASHDRECPFGKRHVGMATPPAEHRKVRIAVYTAEPPLGGRRLPPCATITIAPPLRLRRSTRTHTAWGTEFASWCPSQSQAPHPYCLGDRPLVGQPTGRRPVPQASDRGSECPRAGVAAKRVFRIMGRQPGGRASRRAAARQEPRPPRSHDREYPFRRQVTRTVQETGPRRLRPGIPYRETGNPLARSPRV